MPTCLGVTPPKVGGSLPHQSCLQKRPTGQPDKEIFLTWALLSLQKGGEFPSNRHPPSPLGKQFFQRWPVVGFVSHGIQWQAQQQLSLVTSFIFFGILVHLSNEEWYRDEKVGFRRYWTV